MACLAFAGTACAADRVDFDREIRPILSENCFHCHGPDAAAREADLRLDTREGVFERGELGEVVKPRDAAASELYRRISSSDDAERMPPADSGRVLSARDKELIKRWIDEGAEWSGHWAFERPVEPQLPVVKDEGWIRNPIDRFVLAGLERESLRPAAEADRTTLIRRVTLDLTGLPPTLDEIDAFVNDKSPNAYEKVVNRLLKSPHYGERMAWDWLAAARYADTDGFQGDPTRTMWPWRDWLIQALNDNQPFDQFTIEMLAGDLLPGRTTDQLIATGFNRNHMYNGEGGRIAEETRVENVFDRAETTSTVWLGLTMTCARCHDHKYDPITQREYYQLFAFFNNTSESGSRGGGKAPPVFSFLPPDKREQLERLQREIAQLERTLKAPLPEVDQAQKVWEKKIRRELTERPSGRAEFGAWSQVGVFSPPEGNANRSFDFVFPPEQGVNLNQEFEDGRLKWKAAQELADGKVHALSDQLGATYLYRSIRSNGARTIDLSLGSDDGIKVWLNGKLVHKNNASRAAAADQDEARLELQDGSNELLVKITNTGGPAGFYFRPVRESVAGLSPEIVEILQRSPDKRTAEARLQLQQYFRRQNSEPFRANEAKLKRAMAQRDAIKKSTVPVMVMDDLPPAKRRSTRMLTKGLYSAPMEDPVDPGVPSFLPEFPADAPRNRLTLARWLVDPAHPLTARVTVNRYWQTFFGRGLVATTEDFGRQGSRPTHPELLDWLAVRFVSSGWDVKALHKLIVMSATYRQSSAVTTAAVERDPQNLLLSRSPRFRLPSWMLRDQALALSGLLVPQIGGPSVRPYQPEGIWADATFGKIRYQQDQGASLYRRSLYIFWRRIVGPTMLFDAGKRQTCEVKPTITNTPLHALTTLNETSYVEAARVMGQRVIHEVDGDPRSRIRYAFRLATAREPANEELELLETRWRAIRAEYAAQPGQAAALLEVGAAPRDTKLEPAEHAAYAVICSLLLNLDEVLTRE